MRNKIIIVLALAAGVFGSLWLHIDRVHDETRDREMLKQIQADRLNGLLPWAFCDHIGFSCFITNSEGARFINVGTIAPRIKPCTDSSHEISGLPYCGDLSAPLMTPASNVPSWAPDQCRGCLYGGDDGENKLVVHEFCTDKPEVGGSTPYCSDLKVGPHTIAYPDWGVQPEHYPAKRKQ